VQQDAGLLGDLSQAIMMDDLKSVCEYCARPEIKQCINRPDQDGATVLFTAAAKGNEEVVAALIQAGANMDARDKNGKSPLHMAIAGNHYILVKYLLEAGANTAGVSMRSIRLWSSSNISQRIDQLIAKYPPRKSRFRDSPVDHLTLKEYQLTKAIFDFFDANGDGYISLADLQQQLAHARRGPMFDAHQLKRMIRMASSVGDRNRVSFEDFIEMLAPDNWNQNSVVPSDDQAESTKEPKPSERKAHLGLTSPSAVKHHQLSRAASFTSRRGLSLPSPLSSRTQPPPSVQTLQRLGLDVVNNISSGRLSSRGPTTSRSVLSQRKANNTI